MTKFRVGHGFDVHQLVLGRALIIGGVKIEHDRGLLGHSDADVLLHAISDALLGAAGMGEARGSTPDANNHLLDELLGRVATIGARLGQFQVPQRSLEI